MSEVSLVSLSKPSASTGCNTAEEFIAYAARVSNPSNQNNTETAQRLVKYLIRENHWSPFEMVSITLAIKTTRDIGRQIIRHRSFSFQEFSQRYAVSENFVQREARLQDEQNRQNSIEVDDDHVHHEWLHAQNRVKWMAVKEYENALKMGIAKEQARALLPEGLTETTLYMAGTLRSWIHYCQLRMENGTQKEHMDIASQCWDVIRQHFPNVVAAVEEQ
jgi:thymidylate synthase (FAD)